jgi:copper transport protein
VSTEIFVSALVRWFDFAAFAALSGATGLDLAVLPRRAAELDGVRRRLRRVSGLAAITLVITSAGELGLRARTLAGGGIETTLTALPSVLGRTHFGTLWMLRAAALGLLWLLSRAERRFARWTALLPIAIVALATSLTGHAADRGDRSLAALADWLHVVASAAWTGGLLCLAYLARSEVERPARIGELARRFSRLAGICLLGVVASGSYNAWIELASVSALWSTGYGRILAVKLAFVLGLVAFGAENRFRVVPALSGGQGGLAARGFSAVRWRLGGAPVGHELRFWRLVAREAALALIVFACTALLVQSAPPRHRHQHAPDAASEPADSPLGTAPAVVRSSRR